MIKMGATYKDKITGFSGVATAFCQYITGCNQVLLAPKGEKEAKWFDEQRLVPVGSKVIRIDNGSTPGFDIPAPIR